MKTDNDAPPDVHIQQDMPPIYYCWKYWLTTGEIHEGCTPVNEDSTSVLPDLNDYGWVYMAVPLVGLFLLVFFFYVCCQSSESSEKSKDKKPLLASELSSDEEEYISSYNRARSYAGATAPSRNGNAKNYYTEIQMDHGASNIMPQQHAVPNGYYGQPHMNTKMVPGNVPRDPEVAVYNQYPISNHVTAPPNGNSHPRLKKSQKIRENKSESEESEM